MNIFRILADLSHTASKCILIFAIHNNKSAEGVSLLTQLLYILVFGSRYLDLFWVAPNKSYWNFVLKIFYLSTSGYIVYVMMRVYARTREKEYAWKLATSALVGSAIAAPVVDLMFEGWKGFRVGELFWTFSIILESLCILPQLLLLRQTSVPTVLDSYYLVTLGSYRLLYIVNWIWRLVTEGSKSFDPIAVIFGIIQTALYIDFAWVYYSRQRVKLRGGGVVDSDDLSKSFLVRRIIGRGSRADTEDEGNAIDEDAALAGQENGTIRPRRESGWGRRGISVSADDTLPERQQQHGGYADRTAAGDAQMIDPAHFEDEGDEDVDAPPPPPPPYPKDDKYTDKKAKRVSMEEEEEGSDSSQGAWASNTGAEQR